MRDAQNDLGLREPREGKVYVTVTPSFNLKPEGLNLGAAVKEVRNVVDLPTRRACGRLTDADGVQILVAGRESINDLECERLELCLSCYTVWECPYFLPIQRCLQG